MSRCYTVSQWDTFQTCRRQFKAKHITKEVEFKQTPEGKYGDEVHDAMEMAIKRGSNLPARFAHFQKFLDAIRSRPGEVVAEGKMAVDENWNPVEYFDRSARWRGKLDVSILGQRAAETFDWKTGKRKDKIDQLHLYGTFELAHHDQVEVVRAGFVWLKEQVVSPPVTFKREDFDKMKTTWDERAYQMDRAIEVDDFRPTPSGLCNGWCDVTSCEFWKPKRG